MGKNRYIQSSLLVLSSISIASSSNALTVEDYCDPIVSKPASIREIRPMNDGTSYSAVSPDGRKIEIYSFKTGQSLGTLFDTANVKGDVKIDSFDGYRVSDNGKKILLWTDSQKIYRHSFKADYYVYDIMRGSLKKVSEKGYQRDAVMSHDGRMVAYTRDNNIYISNLDYDTDYAVTEDGKMNEIINGSSDWSYEEEFSMIHSIRWSGDDNVLAFIKFNEKEVPVYRFDNYKSYCEGDPLADIYPSEYTYKYPLAGYPNSKVSVHAFNLNTCITKTMDLPIGLEYVPSIEFDGKGENLMVMLLNRDQNNLRIYRVNPGSTVAYEIYSEKSDAWLNPSAYQMVSYDVDSFIIGSERSGYRHLYEYDYNGNLLKQLSSGDWNVTDYYGKDPKNGRHYLQSTVLSPIDRSITIIDAKGNITIPNREEGTESAIFSKNLQYYVRTFSNARTPNIYGIYDGNGKKLLELENNSSYSAKYGNAPYKEFLKVKNASGEEMNAYIIKPHDFDANKKYPLLMYQYNGPDSQEVLNRWKMEGIYYLASQGYIVACVDGRGTGNRSRSWATSVYKCLGQFETEDQIAGAKYFASLPFVDSRNVACFGWSYGGYMTLM